MAKVSLSPKTLNREEYISSRHTVHRALSGAPLQHEVADHANQRVRRGAVRRQRPMPFLVFDEPRVACMVTDGSNVVN